MEHKTPLLDTIHSSFDMKGLSAEQLKQLADELRQDLIFHVSQTGGHFGASLGVVELTVALHHVFDTPHDRLIWDVGHQSYPHKILTGRRSFMPTLRQYQGLSGFPKRSESPYDAFGTAHSSTSISAALGMAVASDLLGEERQSIAVIGDGAMSAGMAFEAMNNAEKQKLIVILNDNDMSIDPPVGALNGYLSRLISSRPFHKMRELAKDALRYFPKSVGDVARRAEEYARGMVTGGTLFEELGFYYIGPLDGHNLDHLIPVLRNARDLEREGPLLIHVITEKGRGYAPAEAAADKLHATAKFDVKSGVQVKPVSPPVTYTKVFAESLIAEAEADEKIVAVTAAMPSGTGLDLFAKKFPDRCFDVGIAEQHAVTFAAGLACEGIKPVVAIYSTFLQRGYDQVVHDVALQNLPVRFAMDRAGLVGADGATHAGSFDVAYLGCLPNMTLMAAADEAELRHMVATLGAYDQGPIGLRYPRGDVTGKVMLPEKGVPLEIGKGRVLRQGTDVVLLSYGTRLAECLLAADVLESECGISVTVADARFAKPLDEDLLMQLTAHHPRMITIEEGSVGGFGSFVSQFLSQQGIFDKGYIFRSMVLPDYFMDQGTQTQQYAEAQLDARALIESVKKLMGKTLSLCA